MIMLMIMIIITIIGRAGQRKPDILFHVVILLPRCIHVSYALGMVLFNQFLRMPFRFPCCFSRIVYTSRFVRVILAQGPC